MIELNGPGSEKVIEGHIEVQRTARFAQLGTPSSRIQELWVVCHGYRQLAARFMTRFTGIGSPERIVVAPEALNRFYIDPAAGRHGAESRIGASWMTRADRETEIRDYVRYLDRLAGRLLEGCPPETKVVAFGFSQGVHTAARWAVMGNTEVHELVLWGSYLPADLDLQNERLKTLKLSLVYGEEDPTQDEGLRRTQDDRLTEAGIEVDRYSHPGGHRVDRTLVGEVAEKIAHRR